MNYELCLYNYHDALQTYFMEGTVTIFTQRFIVQR